MNNAIEAKKLEIIQQQLTMHKEQDTRAGFLLKFAMVLTGFLYFMFEKHLFLGDAITWGAYFNEWHAALDFILMFAIVVMSAIFLAWVKHHAYLHFGLYGSIGLIVLTVIGFALFAEFFSSSASQDTKSRVMLQSDQAYQSTLTPIAAIPPASLSTGNASAIAKAEQTYARCQSNIGKPGYKHCNGDKATLDSLKASDAAALKASTEVAIKANADTLRTTHERQDKLKADSYNAVIVTIAQFIAAITGSNYTDQIKTATVLTMLIVAVAFEILHHFLAHAKERSQNAVYWLEMELAKNSGINTPDKPDSVIPKVDNDSAFKESSIGFNAPIGKPATAQHHSPIAEIVSQTFKDQIKQPFGFIPNKPQNDAPNLRESSGFNQTAEQLANVKALYQQQLADHKKGTTYRQDLRTGSETFSDQPLDKPVAKLPTAQAPGKTGLHNPALGKAEAHHELPLPCVEDRAHTVDLQTVRDRAHTVTSALASTSIYHEWLAAIASGDCAKTVRSTRTWIQKRLAGSQSDKKTLNPREIDAITQRLFARAVTDPASGIQLNPNYSNGKAKYI